MKTKVLYAVLFCSLYTYGTNSKAATLNMQKKQNLETKLAATMEACTIKSNHLQQLYLALQRNKKTYLTNKLDYTAQELEFLTLFSAHGQDIKSIESLEKELCQLESSIANKSICNIQNYPIDSLENIAGICIILGAACVDTLLPHSESLGSLALHYSFVIGFCLFGGIYFEILKTRWVSQ